MSSNAELERARDYDSVLDAMIAGVLDFITSHPVESARGWPLKLHAIATVYAACHSASIGFRHPFSIAGWNTFKTTIENRMSDVRVPVVASHRPPSDMLVSYTSGYYGYLTALEKLAKARYVADPELPNRLWDELGGTEALRAEWRTLFYDLAMRAMKEVLFKVWLVFEN